METATGALTSGDPVEVLLTVILATVALPILPAASYLLVNIAGCSPSLLATLFLFIYSLYAMVFHDMLQGLIGALYSVALVPLEVVMCPEPHAVEQLMRDLEMMTAILSDA